MLINDINKHIEYMENSIIPNIKGGYLSIAANSLEFYLKNNADLVLFFSEKLRIDPYNLIHQKEEHVKEDAYRFLETLKNNIIL